MRIADALEIPENTGTDAFITRLDTADAEQVRRDMADFVVAAAVEGRLDTMFAAVGERLTQGLDVGRFVYGTFGSGKSHLMAVLGKMFERDEGVYAIGDPALSRLRARHPFIDRRRALVVRLNMMGKGTLLHALFDAYVAALPDGIEPPVFTDEERVFDLIERDAERMGGLDALLARAVADGGLKRAERYHKWRHSPDRGQRQALAAELLNWRNHGDTTLRAEDMWLGLEDGMQRLTEHARDHGYDTIVWLVDELIIWIRGQSRPDYVTAINQLSSLVDHDTGATRAVPFFVVVAVQHDISRTCPADLSERDFHEHLGHVSNRFAPHLLLEDQDLYEVASRRVLRPRPGAADTWAAAVDRTFKKHGAAIKELSGEIDPARVRSLYPFHPALLRALVDITQALSRNRTAMAALYSLLAGRAELEIGQFIPMGDLFPVVFDTQTVASARDRRTPTGDRFVAAAESYERLRGKIDDAARSVTGTDPNELHQLVRTVLLCQLSEKEYFGDGRALREATTASNLLRLNESDVRAMTPRTGVSKVARLFRLLMERASEVRVDGDETDPRITIKTERVEVDAVIARARRDVRHSDRFAHVRTLIDQQLGLGLGRQTEASASTLWRGTRRAGQVRLCNVRTLAYAGHENEFDAGQAAFLVLVDYPFDEDEGCTREDDIKTVHNARARRRQWTVAWLPAHFTEAERQALEKAAAIDRIASDRRRFLEDYSAREQNEIAEALEAYRMNLDAVLAGAIRRVYFDEGQLHALSEVLDGVGLDGLTPKGALDGITRQMLDRRYPRHPLFGREAKARDLEQVAEWVVAAAVTHEPVSLRGPQLNLVEAFAVPLEVAYAGSSSLTPRTDGRYLAEVKKWADARGASFTLGELYDHLAGEQRDGFGLNDDGCAFFAWYLLHAEGYEARRRGRVVTLDKFRNLSRDLELRKGRVVDSNTWERACQTARALLGVEPPGELPSVPNQAKLDDDARAAAARLVGELRALHAGITELCRWAEVDERESSRLDTLAHIADALTAIAEGDDAFDRVQRLAALRESARYATFAAVLARPAQGTRPLVAERGAVAEIGHARLAFQAVQHGGGPAARLAVVTALQNLLRDPVERTLAAHGPGWATTASQHAEALMTRPATSAAALPAAASAPPAAPVPAPAAGYQTRHTIDRDGLVTLLQKAGAAALLAVDGRRLVVELTVRVEDEP
ncbi:MAG: hypothetical protein R3F65_25565 [bacterium]